MSPLLPANSAGSFHDSGDTFTLLGRPLKQSQMVVRSGQWLRAVREAIAEDLEDRALPAVLMTAARFRRELDDGQRPNGLLIDEDVLGHARDLVAALRDVGRVVLGATAANVEPALGSVSAA